MSEITISANKGKKAFKCGMCDKSFPQKFHMERHKVVDHDEKKTFKSKICEKRLALNPNMNKNMPSVHEGKKEVKCKTKIAKSMPAKIVESAYDGQNTELFFDLNNEPSTFSPNPLTPNVLVEVNTDISDPLAMPDPTLVDPMKLQIETEVMDDEPLAMKDSMITDDPFTNPDAGDFTNLMMSSVVSGNDLVGSIATDIEIKPTKLCSDPNNTRSLEIQESKKEKKSNDEKTRERKTRKVLSLDLKLSIIKMYEEGISNTKIARDQGEFLRDISSKGLFVYFSLSPPFSGGINQAPSASCP